MHESMRPAEPDPEQLRASLIAEHGDQQIMLNGQSMAFKDYVAVGDMLCPIPPEQRSPEANLRRLAGDLVKMDVQLDEKYAPYIPEQPKEPIAPQKAETKNQDKAEPAKKSTEKTEPAAIEPIVERTLERESIAIVEAAAEKTEAPKPVIIIPKEIMATTVELLTPDVKPLPPIQERTVREEAEVVTVANAVSPAEQVRVVTVSQAEAIESPIESFAAEVDAPVISTDLAVQDELHSEVLPLESGFESGVIILNEPVPDNLEGFTVTTTEQSTEVHEDIAIAVAIEQSESEPIAAEYDAPLENEAESMSQTPVAVAMEFVEQVLPIEVPAVAERLEKMEPELAVELASRIEMIVIVADRLHELVITGATDGEEAQQIEAFLKREYEQVLRTVGVEPTQELLEKFIAMIHSEDYQLSVSAVQNYVEVSDEGTHEKKLFDEQGVFAKAQQASAGLSKKLGNSIGRILVTNLAA